MLRTLALLDLRRSLLRFTYKIYSFSPHMFGQRMKRYCDVSVLFWRRLIKVFQLLLPTASHSQLDM